MKTEQFIRGFLKVSRLGLGDGRPKTFSGTLKSF